MSDKIPSESQLGAPDNTDIDLDAMINATESLTSDIVTQANEKTKKKKNKKKKKKAKKSIELIENPVASSKDKNLDSIMVGIEEYLQDDTEGTVEINVKNDEKESTTANGQKVEETNTPEEELEELVEPEPVIATSGVNVEELDKEADDVPIGDETTIVSGLSKDEATSELKEETPLTLEQTEEQLNALINEPVTNPKKNKKKNKKKKKKKSNTKKIDEPVEPKTELETETEKKEITPSNLKEENDDNDETIVESTPAEEKKEEVKEAIPESNETEDVMKSAVTEPAEEIMKPVTKTETEPEPKSTSELNDVSSVKCKKLSQMEETASGAVTKEVEPEDDEEPKSEVVESEDEEPKSEVVEPTDQTEEAVSGSNDVVETNIKEKEEKSSIEKSENSKDTILPHEDIEQTESIEGETALEETKSEEINNDFEKVNDIEETKKVKETKPVEHIKEEKTIESAENKGTLLESEEKKETEPKIISETTKEEESGAKETTETEPETVKENKAEVVESEPEETETELDIVKERKEEAHPETVKKSKEEVQLDEPETELETIKEGKKELPPEETEIELGTVKENKEEVQPEETDEIKEIVPKKESEEKEMEKGKEEEDTTLGLSLPEGEEEPPLSMGDGKEGQTEAPVTATPSSLDDLFAETEALLNDLDYVDDSELAQLLNVGSGKDKSSQKETSSNENVIKSSDIAKMNEDEPVYLFTSLAGGGFHMIPRTNRLATILQANRIEFTYRDLGTDDEARKVWKTYGHGRMLPAVVRGRDTIVGNWEEMEEFNEDYLVRQAIYEAL